MRRHERHDMKWIIIAFVVVIIGIVIAAMTSG
jgi:hypothetical protein